MTTSTNPEERSNKNDIGLIEVKIFKPNDEESLTIFPEEGSNARYLFKNMQINEGMFTPAVNGTLVIEGSHPMVEEFNIIGNERIHIEMFTPGIDNSSHSLDFFIHDIYHIEEPVSESESFVADSSVAKNKNITIEFTSYEYYYLNSSDNVNDILIPNDPISKIQDTISEFLGLPGSSSEDYIGSISELVGLFADKYFNLYSQEDMVIEDTTNGVWLKPEHAMYPWSKPKNPMSLINLLENLSENSVSKKNPYAVNYLFWQDLKRWNFRSIDSLLRDDEGDGLNFNPAGNIQKLLDNIFGNDNQKIIYEVTGQSEGVDSILQFSPISEANHLQLQNLGAYKSYFEVTQPDYSDPYHDFVDFSSSHKVKKVGYNYFKDQDKWKHVGEHPLLPDNIEDKIGATRIYDDIYGYFSPEYNNPHPKNFDIMGESSPKKETKLWQSSFDQTELEIGIAKLINKTIKEDVENKYALYLEKKNLYERWNAYECAVCCLDGGGPEDKSTSSSGSILAGGAFTDVVNYDSSNLDNGTNGLELSYDLDDPDSEWNQTIGEFFNLMESVNGNIGTWNADRFVRGHQDIATLYQNIKNTITDSPCCQKVEYIPGYGAGNGCLSTLCNGGFCGCLEDPAYFDNGIYQWPRFAPDFCPPELGPKICIFSPFDSSIRIQAPACCEHTEDCQGCGIGHPECQNLLNSIDRIINIKNTLISIIETRQPIFEEMYEKFVNRKAMPFPNKPKLIEDTKKVNLVNVKSVTRLPIRGSQYEAFPKKFNIKEQEFEDANYLTPTHFGHPWYDRKFTEKTFVNPDGLNYVPEYLDGHFGIPINPCGIPTIDSDYNEIALLHNWDNPYTNGIDYEPHVFNLITNPLGIMNPWGLNYYVGWDEEAYVRRHDIYAIDTETSKPSIIKSWELASYVRVEFESPINEGFLDDFPYGISKNAGDEYFAPYVLLINKMPFPGSSNKQIYILGQDPYGFDIAVKNNASYDGSLVKDVELYPDPHVQTPEDPFYTFHQPVWGDNSPGSDVTGTDLERKELVDLSQPTFMSHANPQFPIMGSSGYIWYSSDWYDFSFDWRHLGKLISGQVVEPHTWVIDDEQSDWEYGFGFRPSMLNVFDPEFKEDWLYAFNQRWIFQHPTLKEEDIWRLDQTGKSLYGIMTPPQKYDVTMPDGSKIQSQEDWNPDRNFAAQFAVVGIGGGGASNCDDYICANPQGPISRSGCPTDEPWCNCPNQELIPRDEETDAILEKPTEDELKNLLDDARHCNSISENLGDDWLGCIWSDPENPNSCSCPGVGENFHKYIEYLRTHSTYWSTPDYTPLYRNAQMNLIQSQRAKALVSGNLSLRPGDVIQIVNKNALDSKYVENSRAGNWLVESISHLIVNPNEHTMSLKLMRDGSNINPNDQGIINRILEAIGIR